MTSIQFHSGDEAAALAARHAGTQYEDPGLSYGAALAGERVICTTDAHGLRSALAQLPEQAAARVPMVLDAGCEPADLRPALDTGWIVLCARDPQAVYDLNLAAVKIGEHPQVRLPVLVAYDGVTRHEKRPMHVLEDADAMAKFLGARPPSWSPLDSKHPASFGARVQNGVRLSQAMEAARGVIAGVFSDLARLTGRSYPVLDAYGVEGAENAKVLLNSAAEAAKEAADEVRVLSPNVLRPFPGEEFRAQLRGVKTATLANGGSVVSMELRAALQLDPLNETKVVEALEAAGGPAGPARPGLAPIPGEALAPRMAKVRRDEASGRLEVELEPLWKMTSAPGRLAPGHGACPGCGAFTTLHQVYKVLEGDVIVLFQSGCASTASTAYSSTAHRISTIHNLAGSGVAKLCGLAEAAGAKEVTFVMIAGDGAMAADMGAAIAAASRNPRVMILEYDNQGRMSTGGQPSPSSALGRRVATDEIFAGCHLPYVFTATEGYPEDLMRKVAKAQWYAKNEGMVYGRILSFCPLNWRASDDAAQAVLQAAIDSCFFPLYEVEHGRTAITYDPDAVGRRRAVVDWLRLMGKTAHLLEEANAQVAAGIQAETDRRWARLKAMHEHPLL